jgi:hypothetical protein
MSGTPITWRLDPTVWKRARLGRCSAEMWCVEIGAATSWAVFGPGAGPALRQGTEPTPEKAQEQAEHTLRAAYEATS